MIFGWKKDPHWVMVKRELQKEKMERIGKIHKERVLGTYKLRAERQLRILKGMTP